MLNQNNELSKTPQWVWWSFVPAFGGLAIAYAGNKSQTPNWKWSGLALTGIGLVLLSTKLSTVVWLIQIGTAFSIKKEYLDKVRLKNISSTQNEITQLVSNYQGQVDINNCSKDELVYKLGLPIVYAHEIDLLREEGYMFTSIEELSDLTGIPDSVLTRIEPLITFSYYLHKEGDTSWRRLNSLSIEELVNCQLEYSVAKKIVEERNKSGSFKSLTDVKKRTGLPISCYRCLV